MGSTTEHKCKAVLRRARIQGSYSCVSLNSRLESNKEQEEDGVNIDPSEVLGSYVCPTVGRMSIFTTACTLYHSTLGFRAIKKKKKKIHRFRDRCS